MLKLFEVWNFGPTQRIRSPRGNIEILRGKGFETSDEELVNYLKNFNMISVKEIDPIKHFEKRPMKELYSLAKERGFKGFFGETKSKILTLLRGGDPSASENSIDTKPDNQPL